MAKKQMLFKIKGMNRDLSVSAFNSEFAFENMNLRLSTNEGNTQMSWVNEKGTSQITLKEGVEDTQIKGRPLGSAVINHQLVLFTYDDPDIEYIPIHEYSIEYIDSSNTYIMDSDGKKIETAHINGTYSCTVIPSTSLYTADGSPVNSGYLENGQPVDNYFHFVVYDYDGYEDYEEICTLQHLISQYKGNPNIVKIDKYFAAIHITTEVSNYIDGLIDPESHASTWAFEYRSIQDDECLIKGDDTNLEDYPDHTIIDKWLVYNFSDKHWYIADDIDDSIITTEEYDGQHETLITEHNYIYKLEYSDAAKTTLNVTKLFEGELGFDLAHPIETLVSYESEDIQKVYWVDGKNQPRVINIALDNTYNNKSFDFVRTLELNETIKIEKQFGLSGTFSPGTIQYAFTYYTLHGQESAIFYTSPLQYISYKDRGASPEDKVENAFKITVENVDRNFDFLRIYSIQRTSINGTPFCKRVQDISLKDLDENNAVVSYIDTGVSGNSVDPTELLYKDGETISAQTLNVKDNTLFFGNLHIARTSITSIKSDINVFVTRNKTREFNPLKVSVGAYRYYNQLTSSGTSGSRHEGMTVPCAGFMTGEKYRLGVQFQHESGKWSEPIPIKNTEASPNTYDFEVQGTFAEDLNTGKITVPVFEGTLSSGIDKLKKLGYKRVRGVVVFPKVSDRTILCQGVCNPTIEIYDSGCTQSSWFFRPYQSNDNDGSSTTTVNPRRRTMVNTVADAPTYIRQKEIEGNYTISSETIFYFTINSLKRTFHSPEVEFDDQTLLTDFSSTKYLKVGEAEFTKTLSDIDIQTETPPLSNMGSGFVHKSFESSGSKGIVSGLFYDDVPVDDDMGDGENYFGGNKNFKTSAKWVVYPWQSTGSLNNDINRPSDKGVASAILKKKVISNLRYAKTIWTGNNTEQVFTVTPHAFYSDDNSIVKYIEGTTPNPTSGIYKGNIDTVITPPSTDGKYGAVEDSDWSTVYTPTPFTSKKWFKTWYNTSNTTYGLWAWITSQSQSSWVEKITGLGNKFNDLVIKKNSVRMKYKSTPHLFIGVTSNLSGEHADRLSIINILKEVTPDTRFGGMSNDALKENVWVPCGEPVSLPDEESSVSFYFDYGDTYFQRYDCLKTYPYTREDINQIVEIGSFMLNTRVNIDGRYDRNRGQQNNLNMTPQNFNLLNPVYSQQDNFFSYRILDDEDYYAQDYRNYIMWSKTKESGADVDAWTNILLASVLELDGDKGEISAIKRFDDQLLCFQDSGISQVLYNESIPVSTENGVPIEIANSGKVQGKRYITNTIGCSNKWSIVSTPLGIYFMDSNDKSIYLFNGQLNNISQSGGFNSWCKQNIPSSEVKWTPEPYEVSDGINVGGFENFVGYYDRLNQDVLFINHETALAWSEKIQAFTSFYDYGNTPFFCNLDDTGIWINKDMINQDWHLWKHQAGNYGQFFDINKPYWMTLVGNPEPQLDKVFTNLEFRACSDMANPGDTWLVPFDHIETWNEYQHGIANIGIRSGHDVAVHHRTEANNYNASLIRKFRIWRCDIPRDNAPYDFAADSAMGISRTGRHPTDRMRNPWLYIKLYKNTAGYRDVLRRSEIHDVVMTYFG